MKKFFILTFCLILSVNSFSQQYYFAGDHLTSYIDLNPDTILYEYCAGSPMFWITDDYSFDVSGDGINDCMLIADGSWSQYGYTSQQLKIRSLDSSFYFRVTEADTTGMGNWSYIPDVPALLNLGDTINLPNGRWANGQEYIYDHYNWPQMNTELIIGEWLNQYDKFIGIKYFDGTDTTFGWLQISVPNDEHTLYFNAFSVTASGIGINDLNSETYINIYPNPTSNILHLKFNNVEDGEIKITDVTGKIILVESYNAKEFNIDVSRFSQGLYFLTINTPAGITSRKILIQR